MSTLVKLYGLAADRAASLTGLRGRARRNAEIERSNAIHAERMRCAGFTEDQLLARLTELTHA